MKSLLFTFILLLAYSLLPAQSLDYRGYVQLMPLRIDAELPQPLGSEVFWEYRVQSRHELQWRPTGSLEFNAHLRARLFAGDLVSDLPDYASVIDVDDGYFNLSWMAVETDDLLLHLIPDRLYADWTQGDWNIRMGRQRINWGINMITNPNDVFNIYSIYEFDYPERPGTDAIRARYYLDWASRIEVAAAPARDIRQSVMAGMYAFNTRGYDIQLIGGYYQNRAAIGGGWAGNIRQSGFKGELMYFHDLETPTNGEREGTVVVALSADHMFENALFAIVEALYNSQGGLDTIALIGQPLSADNPSISTWQLSTQLQYPFNPLLDGSLALIGYPDESGLFISPSLTYSLTQDIDARLLAQFFLGPDDSPLAGAGNIIAGSVKWNF